MARSVSGVSQQVSTLAPVSMGEVDGSDDNDPGKAGESNFRNFD